MSGNHSQFIPVYLVLLALDCATYAVEFAGGTGTLTDPYQIATAEQLIGMGEDRSLCDKHFALTTDIDLDPNLPGGRVFDGVVIPMFACDPKRQERVIGDEPQCRVAIPFSGFFDGRGHVIRNCVVHKHHNASHAGLFPSICEQGIICDLHLERVLITDVENQAQASPYCGALAGENSGHVIGCSAEGDIECGAGLVGRNSGTIQYSYAGGLVGRNYVGSTSGTIIRCYAIGGGGNALVGKGDALNCYFLRTADGGGVDSGYGIALTDAQMRRQESFIGWDFAGDVWDGHEEVWIMPSDGDYPVLRGIETPEFTGSGTAEDPHIIEFRYQLWDIWRHPGAHFRLINDIDLHDQTFTSAVFPSFWGHIDGDGPDNGLGTALTDIQMRQQASFVGWDFTDTWMIDEGEDYPQLRWEHGD